jgi:hypothetical protein
MTAQEKREMLKKRYPDIDFITAKGTAVRLMFENTEYRAYFYDATFKKWASMFLGSANPDTLRKFIEGRF